MSTDATLVLWAIVSGDEKPLKVDIPLTAEVYGSDLKQKIAAERPHFFLDVDPDRMDLWVVRAAVLHCLIVAELSSSFQQPSSSNQLKPFTNELSILLPETLQNSFITSRSFRNICHHSHTPSVPKSGLFFVSVSPETGIL